MESVTSSLSFTAAVTYAAKLSSTTTDTSVQGLLGGVYYGVGKEKYLFKTNNKTNQTIFTAFIPCGATPVTVSTETNSSIFNTFRTQIDTYLPSESQVGIPQFRFFRDHLRSS